MIITSLFTATALSLLSSTCLASGTHAHSHEKSNSTESRADIAKATETIHVTALDTMRFEFDKSFEITDGKTIEFVVTNEGKIRHEFSIGSEEEQINHAQYMLENPDMVHGDSDSAITLEAGETKRLVWTFSGNEEIVFACSLPGHYQAGMLHKQKVTL